MPQDVVVYPGRTRPLLPGDSQHVGHVTRIFALKYHPDDNNVFVSGGWDNALKVRPISPLRTLLDL